MSETRYVGEVYGVARVDRGIDEVSVEMRPKGFLRAVFAAVSPDEWEYNTMDVPAGHGLAKGDQVELVVDDRTGKPSSIKVTKPGAGKR